MKPENQCEKMTFKLVCVDGVGTVAVRNGGYRDVNVKGYFVHGNLSRWDKWYFIIHQDLKNPEFLTVSEASTGRQLQAETYYTVEDALYFAIPFIRGKHTQFSTSVGDILVRTKTNLLARNTTNLQTLAIDTALWL